MTEVKIQYDKEIFSNYRPVSVLPCFSKILERLVFNRCTEFIENNKILNAKQFGYTEGLY